MHVLSTIEDDGTAEMTVSLGEDDYYFDVWAEGSTAYVEYQETLSWRGQIRVSEPDDDIFRRLMISEEMTTFLDKFDIDSVKRADPEP